MSLTPFSLEDMRKAVVDGDKAAKARCTEWVGDAPPCDGPVTVFECDPRVAKIILEADGPVRNLDDLLTPPAPPKETP